MLRENVIASAVRGFASSSEGSGVSRIQPQCFLVLGERSVVIMGFVKKPCRLEMCCGIARQRRSQGNEFGISLRVCVLLEQELDQLDASPIAVAIGIRSQTPYMALW